MTSRPRLDRERLHALHRSLMADLPEGVTDLCPGYVNLYVDFDPARLSPQAARAWVGRHLAFRNGRRPHPSLDRKTPDQACFDGPPRPAAA